VVNPRPHFGLAEFALSEFCCCFLLFYVIVKYSYIIQKGHRRFQLLEVLFISTTGGYDRMGYGLRTMRRHGAIWASAAWFMSFLMCACQRNCMRLLTRPVADNRFVSTEALQLTTSKITAYLLNYSLTMQYDLLVLRLW